MNEPISRPTSSTALLSPGAGLLLHDKAPTISPADTFKDQGIIGDCAQSNGYTDQFNDMIGDRRSFNCQT